MKHLGVTRASHGMITLLQAAIAFPVTLGEGVRYSCPQAVGYAVRRGWLRDDGRLLYITDTGIAALHPTRGGAS